MLMRLSLSLSLHTVVTYDSIFTYTSEYVVMDKLKTK